MVCNIHMESPTIWELDITVIPPALSSNSKDPWKYICTISSIFWNLIDYSLTTEYFC